MSSTAFYLAAAIAATGTCTSSVYAGLPIIAGSGVDPVTQAGVHAMSGQLGGPWINERGIAVGNGSPVTSGSGWAVVRWGPDLPWQSLQSLGTNSSGAAFPKAFAINDTGVVVGVASKYTDAHSAIGTRAVRWPFADTAVTELYMGSDPNLYQSGTAYGVDAAGNAAGTVGATAGFPARWGTGASVGAYLPTLGAPTTGNGTGSAGLVSASGVIGGSATKYSNGTAVGTRTVRWDAGGSVHELAQVGGSSVKLQGISDQGALVGYAGSVSVYLAPGATEYVILAHLTPGASGSSSASRVNDAGMILGTSNKYVNGTFQYLAPVLWTSPTATPIELAVDRPAGANFGISLRALNGSGHAVVTVTVNGASRPVLWNPDGTSVELATLVDEPGWSLSSANDLSDTGWVAGEAMFDPDGIGPGSAYRRFYSVLVPGAGTYGTGDANFDGAVDFDDLLVLAQHYGNPSDGRTDVADLDLNGSTDFDDLLTLAQRYAPGARFASDWVLAREVVPEPVSAGLLIGAALVLRRSRTHF